MDIKKFSSTKQYLQQIERLDRMIQNKLSEIYQLKTMACSITVSNDGERVQTSPDKDRIGKFASKIVDLEKEVDGLVDTRCLMIGQIESMEDTDMYDVLAKRYILGKDLKVLAVEKGISFRHIGRIHGNALKRFEEKYGKTYLK